MAIVKQIMTRCVDLWQYLPNVVAGRLFCESCGRELAPFENVVCLQCWNEGIKPSMMQPFTGNKYEELLEVNGVDGVGVYAVFNYSTDECNVLRRIMHEVKYGGRQKLGFRLGQRAGVLLKRRNEYATADVIVPVPIHRKRLRMRGYNQTAVLAKGIADELGVRVDEGVLKRIDSEKSMVGRSSQERLNALKGAFVLGEHAGQYKGKRIILIDDIVTTGTTILRCASVLKQIEGAEIVVATIARDI